MTEALMHVTRMQVLLTVAFGFVWIMSVAAEKASYVDVFWGLGFMLAALGSVSFNGLNERGTLLLGLTTLWALRLTCYVAWRNWGEPEDRRYAAMRKYHGRKFWWMSFFTVFLLQSILLNVVSVPLQIGVMGLDSRIGPLDFLGIAFWSVGMFFETVGDFQLARFKAEAGNEGKVMERGLWRYTRHPNYFGECCVWWGFYFIAASGGAGWTIFSPIVMTFLLLKVSGVKLLEDTIGERRPDYTAYQRRTSSFIPWPPKPA